MKRGEQFERCLLRLVEILYLPFAICEAIAKAFWG